MQLNPAAYEESKLIDLLAQDSEYAFQLVFDRHRDGIYRLAIRYLKSPVIAQEVVQDVFLKLWFERKNIDAGRPIEPWLYRVAKNHIINQLQKLANEWKALTRLAAAKQESEQKMYDRLEDKYYRGLLQQALDNLPEKQKAVFELARYQNLSYIEIGEQLNISPLTVKTHMARALQSIKAFFAKEGIVLSLFLPLYF